MAIVHLIEGRRAIGQVISFFGESFLLFTFGGAVFMSGFSIGFTLVTQLSLTWIYRLSRYPGGLAHILVSSTLGALLFAVVPLTIFGSRGRPESALASANTIYDVVFASMIGLAGGAAVSFLWHRLVLKVIFARKSAV